MSFPLNYIQHSFNVLAQWISQSHCLLAYTLRTSYERKKRFTFKRITNNSLSHLKLKSNTQFSLFVCTELNDVLQLESQKPDKIKVQFYCLFYIYFFPRSVCTC